MYAYKEMTLLRHIPAPMGLAYFLCNSHQFAKRQTLEGFGWREVGKRPFLEL